MKAALIFLLAIAGSSCASPACSTGSIYQVIPDVSKKKHIQLIYVLVAAQASIRITERTSSPPG